ncbi:amidohydrolase family protein [Ornithinimicrobium tianjinense]|uniref:Cytosine deaminase n=1 Tax=Ornithinimicrobium tianjinense TaxID=1195761 RepID=A0A917F927_9MICO|nr:amidohydrolase family protein [Ornithinimicrobium tianjinense]GGF56751.1 cytosine deaminase [Ornithinimicrobium tianjinense]
MIITDVRPFGADPVDVHVSEGVITRIAPAGGATADPGAGEQLAGEGRLAFPTFADVHCHLDSTLLGLPFRPHTGGPGVWTMMMNDRQHWREPEWPIAQRTTHTLGMMVARGTTVVRSYAQIDADCRLERFEAVLSAKEAFAGRAEVEIIAFPQAGLFREPGVVPLLDEALSTGAATVGGIDPCSLDGDPARHLDTVFELAEKHGATVDIHLHEPAAMGAFSARLILDRTRALSMQGRVTISHGFFLAQLEEPARREMIAELAELDVSMATVAPATSPLPLRELLEAGVRVGLGEDGQRDYWSPNGNADMLFRTWQLAFTQGFRADAQVETALAVATAGGRSVLDPALDRVREGEAPQLRVGDRADLVLLPGETPTALVLDRTFGDCLPGRTVLHAGRVVAQDGELTR